MLFIMDDLKQDIMSRSFHPLWLVCVRRFLSNGRYKQTLIEPIETCFFFFLLTGDEQQNVLQLFGSDSAMEEPSLWLFLNTYRLSC